MSPLIDAVKRQLAAYVKRQHDIQLAYLFGSLARGSGRPDSDIDIAVLAEKPLSAQRKIALMTALAEMFGRPVDLVDLAVAGEPVTGEVLKGVRIHGSDASHAALVTRHVFDTEDFLPYRQRILRERRTAWTAR